MWRRYLVVVLYIAALVGVAALLVRSGATEAGVGVVVLGVLVLVVAALRSRNRSADWGIHPNGSEVHLGGSEWNAGGNGGSGD